MSAFMYRLLAPGMVLFDATATILSAIYGSSMLVILFASLVSSVIITAMSSTARSILCPTYFWDEANGLRRTGDHE